MVAAGTRRGEVTKLRKTTKYPLVLQAANDYLTDPSSSHLKALFLALRINIETSAYRRDLLYRLFILLKMHVVGQAATLVDADTFYQREMSEVGDNH